MDIFDNVVIVYKYKKRYVSRHISLTHNFSFFSHLKKEYENDPNINIPRDIFNKYKQYMNNKNYETMKSCIEIKINIQLIIYHLTNNQINSLVELTIFNDNLYHMKQLEKYLNCEIINKNISIIHGDNRVNMIKYLYSLNICNTFPYNHPYYSLINYSKVASLKYLHKIFKLNRESFVSSSDCLYIGPVLLFGHINFLRYFHKHFNLTKNDLFDHMNITYCVDCICNGRIEFIRFMHLILHFTRNDFMNIYSKAQNKDKWFYNCLTDGKHKVIEYLSLNKLI